jgi:hypothetical protein
MHELDANCLAFLLETVCIFCFFYKLNVDCVFYPVVMGELTSTRPSLLVSTVATDSFCPSLLCYHCSHGAGYLLLQLLKTRSYSGML